MKATMVWLLVTVVAAVSAQGASLVFDWPTATQGAYRTYSPVNGWAPDAGYNSDQTLTFTNGQTIYLGFAGVGANLWPPALISIDAGGSAALTDSKGIGIVDDGGNNFRFVKAAQPLNLKNNSISWTALQNVDSARMSGNQTYSLVYGPRFALDFAGSYPTLNFGMDAAGNVTLAPGSPSFITASGNAITIGAAAAVLSNTGAFGYQIITLSGPGGSINGNGAFVSGLTTMNLTPGYYSVGINAKDAAWLGVSHDFRVTEGYEVIGGSFTYNHLDSGGNFLDGPYNFNIVIPEPASLSLLTLGGLALLRRRK